MLGIVWREWIGTRLASEATNPGWDKLIASFPGMCLTSLLFIIVHWHLVLKPDWLFSTLMFFCSSHYSWLGRKKKEAAGDSWKLLCAFLTHNIQPAHVVCSLHTQVCRLASAATVYASHPFLLKQKFSGYQCPVKKGVDEWDEALNIELLGEHNLCTSNTEWQAQFLLSAHNSFQNMHTKGILILVAPLSHGSPLKHSRSSKKYNQVTSWVKRSF